MYNKRDIDQPRSRILDVGCGLSKTVNSVGVDIRSGQGVDVVHDLDQYPWPFESNSFDVVVANNIFEHLESVIKAFEEIHRILKPYGRLKGHVPHFSSCDFYTDPTHKHPFSIRSFDYVIEGTELFKFGYSNIAKYKSCILRLHTPFRNPVRGMLVKLINLWPLQYERKYAFILPVGTIEFELEVIK